VPTLVATLVASLAGWLVDGPVRAALGPGAALSVSLLVSAVAFYFAKRHLSDLRGGS
jgi:hypothetical protein